MLYACAARFDVTENLDKILVFLNERGPRLIINFSHTFRHIINTCVILECKRLFLVKTQPPHVCSLLMERMLEIFGKARVLCKFRSFDS
jgi:hypothetical protein